MKVAELQGAMLDYWRGDGRKAIEAVPFAGWRNHLHQVADLQVRGSPGAAERCMRELRERNPGASEICGLIDALWRGRWG
jgi:hypothetical protein